MKCQRCLLTLKNELILSRDKLIDMRSKGFLIRPSDCLFVLISTLEKITLQTLISEELNVDTIFSDFKLMDGHSIFTIYWLWRSQYGFDKKYKTLFYYNAYVFYCKTHKLQWNYKKKKEKPSVPSRKLSKP